MRKRGKRRPWTAEEIERLKSLWWTVAVQGMDQRAKLIGRMLGRSQTATLFQAATYCFPPRQQ